MLWVSTLRLALRSNRWPSSENAMSKPVSMNTSVRVGEVGTWPKRKALRVSDQKFETAIRSDSFLSISAIESLMH